MSEHNPKGLLRNEYFQTIMMILIIVVVIAGFWFGSRYILNNEYPALAVASGSMCIPYGQRCDGWSHPFDHTLHIGDLIVVQGVNTSDIHPGPYPVGDIIVFRRDYYSELIVHRAVAASNVNGELFFQTKGDGNYDNDSTLVPADHIVGRVVMRIPWIGHLALFMRNSVGYYLIVVIVIILIVVEIVLPLAKRSGEKEEQTKQSGSLEKVI